MFNLSDGTVQFTAAKWFNRDDVYTVQRIDPIVYYASVDKFSEKL